MAAKCDHSLCGKPATMRASISDNGTDWRTGIFCAAHGLDFASHESFADVELLNAILAGAFVHRTHGHA